MVLYFPTDSADFDPTPLTVRLNATQSEATICVPTLEDTTYEGDETFSIQLSAEDVLSYLEDGEASLSSPVSLGAQGRLVVGGVGVSMVTITDNDCELYVNRCNTHTVGYIERTMKERRGMY